ncbi:hypothetical protein STTU_0373 [Streptomyces sp. Tu6071]|nr:hypothetical protein STTU_0373 [Streptomyces sp. Tu6071]
MERGPGGQHDGMTHGVMTIMSEKVARAVPGAEGPPAWPSRGTGSGR